MGYKIDCRLFTGYKPCRFKRSCDFCPHYDPVAERIAIVSLEAMGAVLRATCLLPVIKRKYPNCFITWITLKNAAPLLTENPHIDELIVLDSFHQSLIFQKSFDIAYGVDKSKQAGGLLMSLQAVKKFGFGVDPSGVIIPLTSDADYQYHLGLDDDAKFFKNQKPETQQITESMGFKWQRDPYVLGLNLKEKRLAEARRQEILTDTKSSGIIGYNTGCSTLFPYKKFTVERAIHTITQWRKHFPEHAVLLLGGPEDTQRQLEMKAAFAQDDRVINSPTTDGLREGIVWMETADLVFSGCSLGLHIAIALKKPAIAWFGVSVSQEIDLYDRGEKIVADVSCTPCWKKYCFNEPKCFDKVDSEKIVDATKKLIKLKSN